LAEGVELQESHYLSKGIYRSLLIDGPKGQNKNPWQISLEGAVQTSKQQWAHLLCATCETRFARNGEDWVFRNGLKNNGKFKLASVLAESPFMLDASRTARIYRAAEIPKINIQALTYFASSIFWRASAHPWKLDGTVPVPLGPFAEPLRQYLLGEAEFPEQIVLTVTVRVPSDLSHLTHAPMGEWRGQLLVAKFPMPGLSFAITAGVAIPQPLQRMCFVRGEGSPLFMSEMLEQYIKEEGVKIIRNMRRRAT
jgi:hypothetical protein